MRRLIAAFLFTSSLFCATAGFGYKRVVTIDRTKCGTANSTDLPVLVYGTYSWLATAANGGRVQSASGFDIAFFADSNLTPSSSTRSSATARLAARSRSG